MLSYYQYATQNHRLCPQTNYTNYNYKKQTARVIQCSQCEYQEQMNCGGCIAIDKPFGGRILHGQIML